MSKLIIPEVVEPSIVIWHKTSKDIIFASNVFLSTLKGKKAKSTIKTYTAKMGVYQSFVRTFGVGNCPRSHLEAFTAHLSDQNLSANTVNLTYSVVRSLYKHLHKVGAYPVDYSVVLENKDTGNDAGHASLSKDQLYQINAQLKGDKSKTSTRNRVMFALLAKNGIRVSELAGATIENLKINAGRRVLYLIRKGHSEANNYVVLQEATYMMILDFVGGRTSGAIFLSSRTGEAMTGGDVSRIIKTIFRTNGIDDAKITAHSLRSTFSIFALEGGADLMALSHALNHKHLSTTQIYLKDYNRLRKPAEDAVQLDF